MLTPQQVAAQWSCSDETVRRLCRSGQLRAMRLGDSWRIPSEALIEYRQRHTVSADAVEAASPSASQPQPATSPAALGPLTDLPADYEPVFKELWPDHVARPATRRGGSATKKTARQRR